jgi:NTP pyrophosphatase (non-canonical NTP hydrolase)
MDRANTDSVDEKIAQRWANAGAGRRAEFQAASAALDDLLSLMADLRGSGGCPWDREQALASLRQYVREEADEVCSAIDNILVLEARFRESAGMAASQPDAPSAQDRARTTTKGQTIEHHPHHSDFDPTASCSGAPLPELLPEQQAELDGLYVKLQEELGDLLLQPVFMTDILSAMGRGGIDVCARSIVSKLIRRHPHVYGEARVTDSSQVLANWDAIKAKERINNEP